MGEHEFGARPVRGCPWGGAVGDQSSDGRGGVVEVLAASEVALRGSSLCGFGDGVFDADPLAGLACAGLLPGGDLLG